MADTWTWAELNPSSGEIDLTPLTAALDEAALNGKCLVVRLKSHVVDKSDGDTNLPKVPTWVLDTCNPLTFYTKNDDSGFIEVAAPWDPCLQTAYLSFAQAVASSSVPTHRALAGLYVHGISSSTGEEMWLSSYGVQQAEAAGMEPELLETTYTQRLEAWATASPAVLGKLVWVKAGYIASGMYQYYDSADAMNEVAATLGLGFRHGGGEQYSGQLTEWYGVDLEEDGHIRRLPGWPFRSQGRYLGNEDEKYFEAEEIYDEWFKSTLVMDALLGSRYLWLPGGTDDDLPMIQHHAAILRWYRLTSGKDIAARPDAVVWLREGRSSYNEDHTCRKYMNFEVGMEQVNADETPRAVVYDRANPDLPSGAQFGSDCNDIDPDPPLPHPHYDHVARRTDVGSGTDAFSFRLDEGFRQSLTGSHVTIRVTYIDDTDAEWSVRTPSYATEPVHGLGDGATRTAIFAVDVADLTGDPFPDGSHLRVQLESNGNGSDLTVKYVRVVRARTSAGRSETVHAKEGE